jgi:hypothetical protein
VIDPLNGSASLTIDLNGFPRGTRTVSKASSSAEITPARGNRDHPV